LLFRNPTHKTETPTRWEATNSRVILSTAGGMLSDEPVRVSYTQCTLNIIGKMEATFHDNKVWGGRFNDISKKSCSTNSMLVSITSFMI